MRRNYHYDYCRNLGQLGPLAIRYIGPGSAAKYLEEKQRRGQKLGDIKASILDGHSGWDRLFEVLS